jgi:hypothetical protein
VPNTSRESRAKNRRVDIVILREATAGKQEPADLGTLGAESTEGGPGNGH